MLATGVTHLDHRTLFDGARARVWANSGGPASRRRTQHVCASLLRDDAAPLRFPRVIRAGIHFGDRDPLDAVLECLARAGFDDAERLRDRYPPPQASCEAKGGRGGLSCAGFGSSVCVTSVFGMAAAAHAIQLLVRE